MHLPPKLLSAFPLFLCEEVVSKKQIFILEEDHKDAILTPTQTSLVKHLQISEPFIS